MSLEDYDEYIHMKKSIGRVKVEGGNVQMTVKYRVYI